LFRVMGNASNFALSNTFGEGRHGRGR
jgi:hypothetical protein